VSPFLRLHHGASDGRGASYSEDQPSRRSHGGRRGHAEGAVVDPVRHGREPRRGGARRRRAAGVVGASVPPGERAALDGALGARPPRHARHGLAIALRLGRPVQPPGDAAAACRRRIHISLATRANLFCASTSVFAYSSLLFLTILALDVQSI
jgi:hypothetical protein